MNDMFSSTLPDFSRNLGAYLTEVTGSTATITALARIAGGASRDMWRVDVAIGDTQQILVLRRDLPTIMFEGALTRKQEYEVMMAAFKSGIRIAQPRWICDDAAVLGAPFFLMDFVPGVAIGRKVVSSPDLAPAREHLADQLAAELAKIHRVNTIQHHLSFLPVPRAGNTPAQEAIDQCHEQLQQLEIDHPAFEFALRWAEQYAPRQSRLTFLHGDFRVGNLIVDTQGLQAVADWEFAHMGDPCEELGYICLRDWRFGSIDRRVGGVADLEPFLRAYEHYAEVTVDRQAVQFWEILGNVRWGITSLAQANRHLSGKEFNIELASLGRRSAEMQLEMLRLIEAWR